MKHPAPPLNIQVASPCPERWDDMTGDDRARFCGQCQKTVYDLSAMTASAAEALVREKEGNLCGRFYRRADGTILHGEDCPVGLVARQWRRARSFAAAAASFVLLLAGINRAQAGEQNAPKQPPQPPPNGGRTMGIICPPPSPSPTPKPTPTPPKK